MNDNLKKGIIIAVTTVVIFAVVYLVYAIMG